VALVMVGLVVVVVASDLGPCLLADLLADYRLCISYYSILFEGSGLSSRPSRLAQGAAAGM